LTPPAHEDQSIQHGAEGALTPIQFLEEKKQRKLARHDETALQLGYNEPLFEYQRWKANQRILQNDRLSNG
jgi:hypothetical protein